MNIWQINGTLFGEGSKTSKNLSGIACRKSKGFPRECLVIDDELQSAQFVKLKDGEINAGDRVELTTGLELDGEGIAYSDGFYYVIGSHGYPRRPDKKADVEALEQSNPVERDKKIKARIAASSRLIRISEDGSLIAISAKLRGVLKKIPELERFIDQPLDRNGVTVEGVAALGDRLYVGLRAPSLNNDQAAIVSVSIDSMFGDAPPRPKLSLLTLGKGRGVRDLASYRKGLLVLAGPSGSESGAYSIFWWDGPKTEPELLGNLPPIIEKGKQIKPEAILPLDESKAGLRVLVLFDGGKQGAPRDFVVEGP
jgi:hypothetical protein